jgi:DNA (cytosine-5)-methyltransferase 1
MTKPPYHVPTMAEIAALPWNGFNAVSTFSGCGGSSTGDRMAGFRMAWANEFVPAAQDTYRANMAPHTVLDTRDIREVTAGELLAAAGVGVGEIDLFDGSPPCSDFSMVGNREGGWGKVKKYSDTKQRVDDLFFEFARLIKETQPRTFVAENVAGLVRGTAKGYFLEILKTLKGCGYRVSAKVLDASWLGVPQVRNRLILVGVREDLPAIPVHPSPLPYRYTVRDVLPHLAVQNFRPIAGPAGMRPTDGPSPSFTTGPTRGHGAGIVADAQDDPDSMADPETGQSLDMRGYAVHDEWRKLRPGQRSKKYFMVRRQHLDEPYNTLCAAQGDVTITGPAHWAEPRKLNLIELRALSSFPPDFVLTGTYGQRWERIGRAVPPVMMARVAAEIRNQILIPLRESGDI